MLVSRPGSDRPRLGLSASAGSRLALSLDSVAVLRLHPARADRLRGETAGAWLAPSAGPR